jgi:hypothetical protein
MPSEDNIRQARNKYGREGLRPELRGRSDEILSKDYDDIMAGSSAAGGLLGAVAVPLLVGYFLPAIGLYLAIGIGAIFWLMWVVMWPRTSTIAFCALSIAALFYGAGSTGDISVLWIDIGPLVSRDLSMWNGPGTWAMAAVAAGPLFFLLAVFRLLPPPTATNEDNDAYHERPPRGLQRSRIYTVLAAPTFLMPVMIFFPVILWSGLFGENGVMRGQIATRVEILQTLLARPLDILSAGLHAGIFWPGGILASVAIIALYLILTFSLIMSGVHSLVRRRAENDYRKERAKKAR